MLQQKPPHVALFSHALHVEMEWNLRSYTILTIPAYEGLPFLVLALSARVGSVPFKSFFFQMLLSRLKSKLLEIGLNCVTDRLLPVKID